ncbi:hypothetical protein Kfla_0066 [Kribbella flavida DSM 17836]|uniref:Uncharacterized protein n=1 Tax=Kribbella flavida (strain DSM 17836 / JCM 10339 / NBRC 14399) TaxID=479435 RepID=D2PQK8_KRIFD|nr:hypothetical protein [Kribbella flavida]ADB29195.1 hypothetical protein Kfla_0066 [Kribbella flavida DSM 17836]
MTVTDFAGILGLVAAALLALWMLLGASTTPHRGDPRHSAPTTDPRPARHRADPGHLLHRLRR